MLPTLTRIGASAGLGGIVLGSFLPWLHSGSATRNSYTADGVLRRTLQPGGAIPALLRSWPYLSLACALAAALLLAGTHFGPGLPRIGTLLTLVCAAMSATVAIWALSTGSSTGLIRVAESGPNVTLWSAGVSTVCAAVALLPVRQDLKRTR